MKCENCNKENANEYEIKSILNGGDHITAILCDDCIATAIKQGDILISKL